MKSHLVVIMLLICTQFGLADLVLLSPEEMNLRQKITETPTHEEVIAAFNGTHHLLYQEAIKWMIINRDTRTWDSLKEQKGKLKENSLKLYPILDFIAQQVTDEDKPLALVLKPEHLQMLAKKGEALPPRYEYSYINLPLDKVLYEILAKDLERFPTTNKLTADAARLIMQYQAPSAELEEAVMRKISQTVTEPQTGKISEGPAETPQESVSSFNPHTSGKIALLVAAVCAALFFCFKLVRSR